MAKITVIIPCYNDGAYIEETIMSVNAQTCQDFEIIIVDDGSEDAFTKRLLPTLENERICLIALEKNSGPSVARNTAISRAKGKYILPLDADDKIAPSYLQKASDILDADDTIGIVYAKAEYFGEMSGEWKLPPYNKEKFLINNMIFNSAMYRKTDWEHIGGYNPNMVQGLEDYDFWMSFIENGSNVYQIQETMFYYRQKNVSRNRSFLNKENTYKMYVQLFKNHQMFYLDHIDILIRKQRELLEYEPFLRFAPIRHIFDAIKTSYRLYFHIRTKLLSLFKGSL